jgi:hypothetical protein
MCTFAKVDALLFFKKYRPRAPVVDNINATMLLESFRKVVDQFSPPIQLRIDHLIQMIEFTHLEQRYHTC